MGEKIALINLIPQRTQQSSSAGDADRTVIDTDHIPASGGKSLYFVAGATARDQYVAWPVVPIKECLQRILNSTVVPGHSASGITDIKKLWTAGRDIVHRIGFLETRARFFQGINALLYTHLAAGNCLVQKSLHIIGKTRFGVSSSPTYLLPILLSPSFNGWLRFIQIRSSAAWRNISKVCSPTLNDTIRRPGLG